MTKPLAPVPSRPLWSVLRSREEYGHADLPLLTVISEQGVRVRDLSMGRAPAEDLSTYRVVRAGDLVVNKLWARFGAYGVSEHDGIISPAYWVLKIEGSGFIPRFLHYLLRSAPYRAEVWRRSKDQPPNGFELPWDQFRTIQVPVIDLVTQDAIVRFLDRETTRIDALTAAKRRTVELLREKQDALIRTATRLGIEGAPTRVVPIPWIQSLPTHWDLLPMKRVGRLQAGVAFPDDEQGRSDEALQYFKASDLTLPGNEEYLRNSANTVTVSTARQLGSPIYPPDSILFPKIGAALLTNRRRMTVRPSCSDQNIMALVVRTGVPRYYYYLLQSFDFGRLRMPGPVPLLNESDAANLFVVVPPAREQLEIVAYLDERLPRLQAAIDLQKRALDTLEERRVALVTKAIGADIGVSAMAS